MLNKERLESLLKCNVRDIAPKNYNNIQWKIQNSDSNSIVFLKLNENFTLETLLGQMTEANKDSLKIFNRKIDRPIPNSVVIEEGQWPDIQKELCDALYPIDKDTKIVAVTGTNGKTTTVDLLRQISVLLNKNAVSIGTLGVFNNNQLEESFAQTTPHFIDLRKTIFKYQKSSSYFFIEVSSHSLIQKRTFGIKFEFCIWTNFTQDHLDYHLTIDDYFLAKTLVFEQIQKPKKVYVCKKQSSLIEKLKAFNVKIIPIEIINKNEPAFLRLLYNAENFSLAVNALKDLYNLEDLNISTTKLKTPSGRFNTWMYNNALVVVDFAHTPDAVENLLSSIKNDIKPKKLISIFGCGGNRDRLKRPLMGAIAQKYSDEIILTNDNPRNEEPAFIIEDIKKGLSNLPLEVQLDRAKAIRSAMERLKDKECLVIFGKGHEPYIEIKGIKHPYSDIDEVSSYPGIKNA